MQPVLNDGDYILTYKPRKIHAGLIYILRHVDHGKIVKRITRLEIDISMSDDSETNNSEADILGVKIAHYQSDNPQGSAGVIAQSDIIARAWLAVTPKGIKRL